MERSITNIGGKFFPAIGNGNLPQADSKKSELRYTAGTATVALVTLAGLASNTFLLPVAVNVPFVILQSVFLQCEFLDASPVAGFNCTQSAYLLINNVSNLDANAAFTAPLLNSSLPLNIQVGVNAARQISIATFLNGGDVNRLAGVTPAASDNVTFRLTVSYLV